MKRTRSIGQVIYDSYPDVDLLGVRRPRAKETLKEQQLTREVEDGLFKFLVRELEVSGGDLETAIERCERARNDVEMVLAGLRQERFNRLGLDPIMSKEDEEASHDSA